MFIMSERGNKIVNSGFIQDYYTIQTSDSAVVYATFPENEKNLQLGKYSDRKEADDAMGQLFRALAMGEQSFIMPPSRLYSREYTIKNARINGKEEADVYHG